MKFIQNNTETYSTGIMADGSEFFIDIVTNYEEETHLYEAWLYLCNYDVKEYMFGCPIEQQTKHYFMELVERNLYDYIKIYIDDYVDER